MGYWQGYLEAIGDAKEGLEGSSEAAIHDVPAKEVIELSCIEEAWAQQAPEGEGGLGAVPEVVVLPDPLVGSVIDVPQQCLPFKMLCYYSRWVVDWWMTFLNEIEIFNVE